MRTVDLTLTYMSEDVTVSRPVDVALIPQVIGFGPRGPRGADGSDKHYEQTFTSAASVTVMHNLGKIPAVTVIDSANDEVVGDIQYINSNQLIVSFSAPFSGVVLCN